MLKVGCGADGFHEIGIEHGLSPGSHGGFLQRFVIPARRFFKKIGESLELIPMQLKVVEQFQEVIALDRPNEALLTPSCCSASAKRQQQEQAQSSEPETIAQGEGVEVIADRAADRVRIVFAAKPDVQMIAKLKSEAWRWAPSEGAWQRKLTGQPKPAPFESQALLLNQCAVLLYVR